MSHLAKLKIVLEQSRHSQSKTEHRRAKLLEKLDEQLAMVDALIAGEIYARTRKVWRENELGERVLVDKQKRTRPWYWMSAAGGCYFQVWYGSRVLELKPGMTAINVSKREELSDVIRSVMEAVTAGELDAVIDGVTERNKAQLAQKSPAKLVKKAS